MGIAEYYRFAEENPADSMVFFRIKVNFRDLTVTAGLVGRAMRQCHACAAVAENPGPGLAGRIRIVLNVRIVGGGGGGAVGESGADRQA